MVLRNGSHVVITHHYFYELRIFQCLLIFIHVFATAFYASLLFPRQQYFSQFQSSLKFCQYGSWSEYKRGNYRLRGRSKLWLHVSRPSLSMNPRPSAIAHCIALIRLETHPTNREWICWILSLQCPPSVSSHSCLQQVPLTWELQDIDLDTPDPSTRSKSKSKSPFFFSVVVLA